ncbi:hypothetical protein CXF46_06235 [Corynebacterium bovis]|nr:hypothetical protein CXF29_00350 [Corynebacterium bovis]RRQ16310.1 hypothetical protein CXF46_06235 [Corynebacterium bovis]
MGSSPGAGLRGPSSPAGSAGWPGWPGCPGCAGAVCSGAGLDDGAALEDGAGLDAVPAAGADADVSCAPSPPSSDPQAPTARSVTRATAPAPRPPRPVTRRPFTSAPVLPSLPSLLSLPSSPSPPTQSPSVLQVGTGSHATLCPVSDPAAPADPGPDRAAPALNREVILTAARGILDDYGLADLTMRRLARSLDVVPGALYWHIPSKQALLGGVADDILADVTVPDLPDWRDRARDLCATLHDRLTAVRDGAEVVTAALASGTTAHDPAALLTESLGGALDDSPAARDLLATAGWALSRLVLAAATDAEAARSAAAAAGTSPAPGGDGDLRTGVDLILSGLSARDPRR